MNQLYEHLVLESKRYTIYLKALGKWLLVSGIVGILCGSLGAAFHIGVDMVTEFRTAHSWLIWLLPAAGVPVSPLWRFMLSFPWRVRAQTTSSARFSLETV